MEFELTELREEGQKSLPEYWNAYKHEIANERGWNCKSILCAYGCHSDCAKGTKSLDEDKADCHDRCKDSCWRNCKSDCRMDYCPTLATYDNYVNKVAAHIKSPIASISFDNIISAIKKVQEAFGYADATARSIGSCISIIFRYAEKQGIAVNVMKYSRLPKSKKGQKNTEHSQNDLLEILTSSKPDPVILSHIKRELKKHKTKSLAVWQMEKLVRTLWRNVEGDGRYCLIALMFYTGIRPAEGRALFWRDIVPFIDHPESYIVQIFKTRDRNGILHNQTKTENGYRRVPIHPELKMILEKRLEHLRSSYKADINDLPVCCFKNYYEHPCTDYEAAKLADEVFSNQLKLKQSDMYAYMLDMAAERLEGKKTEKDEDQQLTLYVLRRNFWTWMEAQTTLTDFEKCYVMGHKMMRDNKSVRHEYNDENRLWHIYLKMSHCVLNKDLHEPTIFYNMQPDTPVMIDNRGICYIHLSKEILEKGGVLHISATTQEPGEAIRVKSLSALQRFAVLDIQASVSPRNAANGECVGINCEFENWEAHQHPTSPDYLESPDQDGE